MGQKGGSGATKTQRGSKSLIWWQRQNCYSPQTQIPRTTRYNRFAESGDATTGFQQWPTQRIVGRREVPQGKPPCPPPPPPTDQAKAVSNIGSPRSREANAFLPAETLETLAKHIREGENRK